MGSLRILVYKLLVQESRAQFGQANCCNISKVSSYRGIVCNVEMSNISDGTKISCPKIVLVS